MKAVKLLIILLLIASGAQAADSERKSFYIELEFNKIGDRLDVNAKETEFRKVTTDSTFYSLKENVKLKLLTKTGKVVFTGSLPVSFIDYANTYPPSTPNTSETTQLEVYPPYNENSVRALVFHDSEVIGNFSLTEQICVADEKCSSYCEGKGVDVDCTCGDDVCQESANEDELCPQDCETPSQPNQQDQEGSDEANQEDQSDTINTSQEQPVEVVDSGTNTGILVLIGILFILVALVLASGKVSIEA